MPALFVRNLTVIDSARLDPETGLTGDSWIVDLRLDGQLDPGGMLVDFGELKTKLKREIDSALDHKLLVPLAAAGVAHASRGGVAEIALETTLGRLRYRAPDEAVRTFAATDINGAALVRAIETIARAHLPARVSGVHAELRHEPAGPPLYRYTHGLKHHTGNCQRMGHGHRASVAINVDGVASPELQQTWCKHLDGCFIGTRAHLVSSAGAAIYRFEYTAAQGRFELELPAARCYLIDGQSTVEHIAEHIAERVAHEHPGRHIRVTAFEGVGKGAIAET